VRNCAFIVLAFGLAQTVFATQPKPGPAIPSGIYSSVTESEETGDRGGIELRLYAEAKPAYVEAVVCQSECDGEGRYYISPNRQGFTFTWKNPRFPEQPPIEFQVWRSKKDVWIQGVNGDWGREKLKRVKKPLGLYGYNSVATSD
jgi:hypothetical protein